MDETGVDDESLDNEVNACRQGIQGTENGFWLLVRPEQIQLRHPSAQGGNDLSRGQPQPPECIGSPFAVTLQFGKGPLPRLGCAGEPVQIQSIPIQAEA